MATLLNNLFGRSKEPFWQQAYTDLLKFVISLRRISDGYTTLSEVYRYIINESQIDHNIRALQAQFRDPPEVLVVSRVDFQRDVRRAPWTLWAQLGSDSMAHPYGADLEGYLSAHDIPFEVRKGTDAICANRRHRLEAIHRWYYGPWTKLDQRVKASIVEGVVVFLSLFDENPEVYRAFCPPRQAYAQPPKPGEPRPLPPLDELLESGHVLGLELPGRPQSRARAWPGRHAEARFPARGVESNSEDLRESDRGLAGHPVRRGRIPRIRDRR